MNQHPTLLVKMLLVLCCAAVGLGFGGKAAAQSRPMDEAAPSGWTQRDATPVGPQPAEPPVPIQTASFLAFCDSVTEIPRQECEALVALYTATQGAQWVESTGWLATSTPCSWFGITCSAGHVTTIALDSNGLSGTIPAQLGALSQLVRLWLRDNRLTGTIPAQLGNLASLEQLILYANQLTGPIPTQLGNLAALQELWLNNNFLSGSIPPSLGDLHNLRLLSLFTNELSGSIPGSLGNLAALETLGLQWNELSGSIPAELGNLSRLRVLALARNALSGELPAGLGQLISLETLSLHANALSGPIPPELGNLTALHELDLAYLDLTGEIPPQLGNLAALRKLSLSYNRLSGPIPSSLGDLAHLQTLNLRSNALEGDIPIEIANLANLNATPSDVTDLSYNKLTSSDAAVWAFLAVKDPDWALTQTIAPGGVSVSQQGASSYQLAWTPIPYQADGGYYEISYATARSGPYDVHGHTTSKSDSAYLISFLPASDTYYFRLRTYTPLHEQQNNELWSAYTSPVHVGPTYVMLPMLFRDVTPVCYTGPWEAEPNNTFAQANGPLCAGRDYVGYPNDGIDMFKFFTSSQGPMVIDVTGHSGQGVQLQVFYQSANNRVAFDHAPPYHIEYTGPLGWYYVYIFTAAGFNTSQPYALRVQFSSQP